jgi:hypothetical protein
MPEIEIEIEKGEDATWLTPCPEKSPHIVDISQQNSARNAAKSLNRRVAILPETSVFAGNWKTETNSTMLSRNVLNSQ